VGWNHDLRFTNKLIGMAQVVDDMGHPRTSTEEIAPAIHLHLSQLVARSLYLSHFLTPY
jgi:hypothetical protein